MAPTDLHTLVTSARRAGPIAVGVEPKFQPGAVLSIGDHEAAPPVWFDNVGCPKLRIRFDDVTRPHLWYVGPSAEDAHDILRFLAETLSEPVLIHCAAGISRSSAAAFLRLALRDPETATDTLRAQVTLTESLGLRDPVPAQPNILLVRHGLRQISPFWRAAGIHAAPELVWKAFTSAWYPAHAGYSLGELHD